MRGEYELVKPILMKADVLSMKTGVAHKFSVAPKASHFVLKAGEIIILKHFISLMFKIS